MNTVDYAENDRQEFVNVKLHFNLRQTKNNVPTLLYCVYSVNGQQYKVATGLKVYPSQWDGPRQMALESNLLSRRDNRNNHIVNSQIEAMKSRCNTAFQEVEKVSSINNVIGKESRRIFTNVRKSAQLSKENSIFVRVKQFDMKNTSIKTEPMTLYLRRISDDYRRKKGIDGSQHDRTIAKIQEFFDTHPDEENDKSQLNLKFYNRFKAWLEDGSGLQVKSILESEKGLRYFCKLINQTEERDGTDRIAVESFALSEDNRKKEDKQAKSEPLTEAEVEALWSMNDLTDRETEARDIFIAQCLCGQRISDLPKVFSPDAVISHVNGNDFISLRTQKTDETAVIPILPQLAVLREKYCCGFQFFKLDTTKSKTHINQIGYKINNELKQIGKKAGLVRIIEYNEQVEMRSEKRKKPLYELLHSHTARHTFVTIMARKGVSKDVIKLVTAHVSSAMIDAVYLHVTKEDKMKTLSTALQTNENLQGGILFNIGEVRVSDTEKQASDVPSNLGKEIEIGRSIYVWVHRSDRLSKETEMYNRFYEFKGVEEEQGEYQLLKFIFDNSR